MAESKYAKYVTKMQRRAGMFHDVHKGKATIGPPKYEKSITEVAPIHIEVFTIYGAGTGFGMNTPMGPYHGKTILDLPHKDLRRARAAALKLPCIMARES